MERVSLKWTVLITVGRGFNMCRVCNGTGRVVHQLGKKGRLGAAFIPCPNDDCQTDARQRTEKSIKRIKAELAKQRGASA